MIEKRKLLDYIAQSLEALGTECYLEDIGGREALTVEFSAPEAPADCSISVAEPCEGTFGISLLVTVFTGLDAVQTERVSAVIGQLNKYLTLGSFSVIKEGVVFFDYTFILDDELPETNMLAALFASLDTVTASAAEGKAELLPLVNGEITSEEFLSQDDLPGSFQ